jgi:hypothetical protein
MWEGPCDPTSPGLQVHQVSGKGQLDLMDLSVSYKGHDIMVMTSDYDP